MYIYLTYIHHCISLNICTHKYKLNLAIWFDIYHCCNKNHNLLWYSHFIVPELGPDVKFSYASHKAVDEYNEAKAVSLKIALA